jgi:hypothetical protein
MVSFEVGSVVLEAIPSFFMLLSLYLHHAKVFKRTIKLNTIATHLMRQKDLFEFGIVQMAVGAVASYLEGYHVTVAVLIGLMVAWLAVPYFTMTIVQGNRLGWVKNSWLCVIYIIVMLTIAVGTRYVEAFSESNPTLLEEVVFIGLFVGAAIFSGEYSRS